ncbi:MULTISPECIES: hypothetical protein [Rhodococcus]|uniref:hypothetical protein n=1 Tax=Rhodococcus TaxID=1827 RepID=UPI0009789FC2|nr:MULTISPECIES: hypothetical protein [Rhodococcus]MCC4303988.1 hypothetical protein [Rhodococcus sp. 3-2]OMQ29289.1 hypothetical protein BK799_26975 [Rhodococcus sp. D-1]
MSKVSQALRAYKAKQDQQEQPAPKVTPENQDPRDFKGFKVYRVTPDHRETQDQSACQESKENLDRRAFEV